MSKKEGKKEEQKEPEKRELEPWYPREFFEGFEDIWEDFRRNWAYPMVPRRMLRDLMSRHSRMDLIDSGDYFELEVETPGIPKDEINVHVTKNSVEISGKIESEKSEEKKNYVVKERGMKEVYRRMTLPAEVIPEKAEATTKDGVLLLKIPKKVSTKAEKVKVTVR